MAEDAKPDVKATVPATAQAPPTERTPEVLGTMQMPAGAGPSSAPALLPTRVPANAGPGAAAGAPPPMPSDWRYDIGREIARGGMGRVVEATDTVLGRTVALKEALAVDPESIRRFQRETRITARLEHPSIVPVHDAGFAPSGSPYYVMRKISGRPLEELVGAAETVEARLALLPHVVAAANAVAHAHARGVVHRDIKPSNILAGDLGETIVIDWGLAKVMDEPDDGRAPAIHDLVVDDDALKTRVGIVFGTPGFMAPEQLRGARVNEQCDVYALGATLYHLLARRPPHHAPGGEAMMKAAVAGPPVPLRELVPGVPPELATIVDKALAFDPGQRYADAGALAEDLQRFLTGQLVASHHYSRRERLVRFVRQRRALLAVSAAAVVAMAIGGFVAIRRIVDERDRADASARVALQEKHEAERAREDATDKLARLVLAEAEKEADDDPTKAVEMVKPYANQAHWSKARAIAAKARAAGVAFQLPASSQTPSLELTRDGTRLIAGGNDGTVRLHDLARRTSETIAKVDGSATARFADGDRCVVIAHGAALTIVEPATGKRRDVAAAGAIDGLAVSGPLAYWFDRDGALWSLDVAAGAPIKLAVDERVHAVVPSPDGRWIALAGDAHLLLLDRAHPTLPPEAPVDGSPRDLAWAADASHLAALIGSEVLDVAMQPAPTIVHKLTVGERTAVAYSAAQVYTTGPTGIAIVRDESRKRMQAGDYRLGLRETSRGVVAGGARAIAVMSEEGGDVVLHSARTLLRVEASPRSPYVVAAAEDRLLVWDLDAPLPRRMPVTSVATGAMFVDRDQLIVTFLDAPAQWIDLRTNKATPLGVLGGLRAVDGAPDRSRALVIDGGHRARVVAPGREPIVLDGEIDAARFLDDQRWIVATAAGVVRVDDGQLQRALVSRSSRVVALAVYAHDRATPQVAAAFADRVVWRADLAARREATLELDGPCRALAIDGDGVVVFAVGNELRAWHRDGRVRVLATLTKPIAKLALGDDGRVLAIADGGNAVLVGLGEAHDVRPAPAAPRPVVFATDGLVATTTAAGQPEVIDARANVRWTLAAPRSVAPGTASLAPDSIQISPDGHRVLATGTSAGVLVWTQPLPDSPEATAAWLDAMTGPR